MVIRIINHSNQHRITGRFLLIKVKAAIVAFIFFTTMLVLPQSHRSTIDKPSVKALPVYADAQADTGRNGASNRGSEGLDMTTSILISLGFSASICILKLGKEIDKKPDYSFEKK